MKSYATFVSIIQPLQSVQKERRFKSVDAVLMMSSAVEQEKKATLAKNNVLTNCCPDKNESDTDDWE